MPKDDLDNAELAQTTYLAFQALVQQTAKIVASQTDREASIRFIRYLVVRTEVLKRLGYAVEPSGELVLWEERTKLQYPPDIKRLFDLMEETEHG